MEASVFAAVPPPEFKERVEGRLGHFVSPAGQINYILTTARLGQGGEADPTRALTRHLRPMREIIPPDRLRFGELLQRDLDDGRVASELVPYLLRSAGNGPAFFPPILTFLLPFQQGVLQDHFPTPEDAGVEMSGGMHMSLHRYGDAFQSESMVDEAGDPHWLRLGRLRWNPGHSQLVVLDGQHRAMALLAIERTVNGTWDNSEYRLFYESVLAPLLGSFTEPGGGATLEGLEIPVVVAWLPAQGEGTVLEAARRLFVVVNREAKQPSPSRLVLLSDTEILPVLVQRFLDSAKESADGLPLPAIEYDNPDRESPKPVRWSAVLNLEMLYMALERGVFGPANLISDMRARPGRLGPFVVRRMDEFMREFLDLGDVFPTVPDEVENQLPLGEIGNHSFDAENLEIIVERALASWGIAIDRAFSEVMPYRAHCAALSWLAQEWVTGGAEDGLAKRAIFEGGGLYWTIRASRSPEIRPAGEVLSQQREIFRGRRAFELLGEGDHRANSDRLYDVYITHACQLGLVLAFGSVAHALRSTGRDFASWTQVDGLSARLVAALNASLDTETPSGPRVQAMDKEAPLTINRIQDMNTNMASNFRYFWLEMLAVDEAEGCIPEDEMVAIRALRDAGRQSYFEYRVGVRQANLTNLELDPDVARALARLLEQRDLQASLAAWFGANETAVEDSLAEAVVVSDEHRLQAEGLAADLNSGEADDADIGLEGEDDEE